MNTLKQNKLLNYSALAGTFLFIADKSNAQIVYTDLDPDHAGTYIFDFNDDGTNEMYLDENFNILSYGSGTYVGTAQINLRNIGAGFVQAVLESNDFDVAILNTGYAIGSGANIDSAYYVVDCAFGTTAWVGQENKFIGVKFNIGADTHYGWIRISVNENFCDEAGLTIHDFAYEANPGTAIIAGETGSSLTCNPPVITSTIIQPLGVKLFWGAVDGASAYKIKYREVGTTVWSSVNSISTHKKISGLECNTSYEYKMYTLCDDGTDVLLSDASPLTTVTTSSCRIGDINSEVEVFINIYPNPAINNLFIDVEGLNTDKLKIEIYSLVGESVKTIIAEDADELQIDITDLSNGIYTINISDGEKSISEKFIKQ